MYKYLSLQQISPLATTSNQTTRLMSMEELTSSAMGRQNMEASSLRLVRVDRPSENTRPAGAQPSSDSSKRQSHMLFVMQYIPSCFHVHVYLTYCASCVLFIGRGGEQRMRGGQEKQKSHSNQMTPSSLCKRLRNIHFSESLYG